MEPRKNNCVFSTEVVIREFVRDPVQSLAGHREELDQSEVVSESNTSSCVEVVFERLQKHFSVVVIEKSDIRDKRARYQRVADER